jgi:hypothetical protein
VIYAWTHFDWFRSAVLVTWSAVETASLWLWHNVFEPVFHGIQDVITVAWNWIQDHMGLIKALFAPVLVVVEYFHDHWSQIWSALKAGFEADVAIVRTIFGYINDYGIKPIESAIKTFESSWSVAWSGIKSAVSAAWDFIRPIIDLVKSAASGLSSIVSTVSGAASTLHLPGFNDGGWVPGPIGAPMLAVVHGGEFVVSRDMQRRGQGAPTGGGSGGRGQEAMIVHSNVYLDGQQIHSSIQRQALRYNQRNSTNGLALLAGR